MGLVTMMTGIRGHMNGKVGQCHGGTTMATRCSEEQGGCPIICDFCAHYEDDGIIGKTEGYCLEHEKIVAIDFGCDNFYCMNIKE